MSSRCPDGRHSGGRLLSEDLSTGISANGCGLAVQLEHVRHQMHQTFRNITQLLIALPPRHTIKPPSNTLYDLLGQLPLTGCKQVTANKHLEDK